MSFKYVCFNCLQLILFFGCCFCSLVKTIRKKKGNFFFKFINLKNCIIIPNKIIKLLWNKKKTRKIFLQKFTECFILNCFFFFFFL